jgi:hypothetical protein
MPTMLRSYLHKYVIPTNLPNIYLFIYLSTTYLLTYLFIYLHTYIDLPIFHINTYVHLN